MNPSIKVSLIIKIPYELFFFMSFLFQENLSMIFKKYFFIIDFNDLGPSITCVYFL